MKKRCSYLRAHRRQCGLSQQELAFLLGLNDRSSVSWLELAKRDPNLKVALGCEALFGLPAKKMFPKSYGKVQDALIRRAYILDERLKRKTSPTNAAKRQLLREALARATAFSSHQEA